MQKIRYEERVGKFMLKKIYNLVTVEIQILSREKWSFFGKNNNMDGPHFVNNMMKETLVVYYIILGSEQVPN